MISKELTKRFKVNLFPNKSPQSAAKADKRVPANDYGSSERAATALNKTFAGSGWEVKGFPRKAYLPKAQANKILL